MHNLLSRSQLDEWRHLENPVEEIELQEQWKNLDKKIGKDKYHPLEQDSIDVIENLGGEYQGKLKMLMTRMVGLDPSKSGIKNAVKHDGKGDKFEPIFVFYKHFQKTKPMNSARFL